MERLTLAAFEAEADVFDRLVLETPRIDPFCSSSAWVLSAHEAFHPEQEPWVFRSESGYLVLAEGRTPEIGTYLAPLEAMWGLASPLVGFGRGDLAAEACDLLCRETPRWDALWLCGLDPRSVTFSALAVGLSENYSLFRGPVTRRHVAALDGGVDGYLGRRSSRFRANLRRADRRAVQAGITWTWVDTVPSDTEREALFSRALRIDEQSWKGLSGQGLGVGGMAAFYDRMTARLAARGALRLVFATLGGEDIAMGFGAVFGTTFRGLQMSFDERFRHLSPGNLVQLEMLRRLEDEAIGWYDLGTDIGYKSRWGEPGLETVALVVRR